MTNNYTYLSLIVIGTTSQKNIDASEVLSGQIDETCQNLLPSISLYRVDVNNVLKRFTVLKFKDIYLKDEVRIVSAYLFYNVSLPFTLQENQTLFIAPIQESLCATCDILDTITDFEEVVQPHMITEWAFQYHHSQTLGLSPNISMYITDQYAKYFPKKFAINFLIFWKDAEATLPLDLSSIELVINYKNYPGGILITIESL